MPTPNSVPSVLSPFAAKGETWTYSDIEVRCKRVVDRALDECTAKLNAVVAAPDRPVDLTEAEDALRHLGSLARKLGVTEADATAEVREVESAFVKAKEDARAQNPEALELVQASTRAITKIYAHCRGIAALLHAVAHQKVAQQRAKDAQKKKPAAEKPAPAPSAATAADTDEPLDADQIDLGVFNDENGDGEATQIGKNDDAASLRESEASSSDEEAIAPDVFIVTEPAKAKKR